MRAACLLVALLGAACRPATPPPSANAGAIDGPASTRTALEWGPCEPAADRAECATLTAPLDYDAPNGDTIEVSVMRIRSRAPADQQLWYLAGGPGGAGTSLLPLLQKRYGGAWQGTDLYAVDHRGTGGTERLSCPEQEAPGSPGDRLLAPDEVAPCIASLKASHGERLAHLDIANSARDLDAAIEASRGSARVVLWGNSYGTHWADRFVRLFPHSVDGVFLEALVPGEFSYRGFDYWMNHAGMRLMQRCADDAACRARLGGDPVGVATALPARLAAGHCAALELPVPVSWFLGSLLYDHTLRDLIPLLVRMVDRCGEQDIARLKRMYAGLFADNGMLTAGDFSPPAHVHVILSELWDRGLPDGASLEAVTRSCLFCPSDRADLEAARSIWPRYEPEPMPPASYDGPMWMLQGDLDPGVAPDVAAAMGREYAGPHQHYIEVGGGAHTLTGKTPGPEGDCALTLLHMFVEDPSAEPDDCAASVTGPDFVLAPSPVTAAFLGEGDPWAD